MELRAFPAAFHDVAELLEPAHSPGCDTSGGMLTLEETCRNALCFRVEAGGEVVGAYALQILEHAAGPVAWIKAAGGRLPGGDLTASLLPAIEAQLALYGVRCMAIQTRRLGLVKKLARQGYFSSGVTMRKILETKQ